LDKTRKYISLICDICKNEYKQQERVFSIAKWKNRCVLHRGNYKKKKKKLITSTNKYCVDCNNPIWDLSTRCKSCSGKKRRTLVDRFCIDCKNPIFKRRGKKDVGRCLACHNIAQNKGYTTERNKFTSSKKWKDVRLKRLHIDNNMCVRCYKKEEDGIILGTNTFLHIHHIKEYSKYPELRLDINNLETLCRDCHYDEHKRRIK
jgi:5-methylcytosine-specific restriction endonuclease McrA